MPYERELKEAFAAAELAGRYVKAEYESFVPIPNAPATFSTHVDRESQEIILKYLRAAFPEDGLVAEERTPTLDQGPKGTDRVWIVDPIDGSRGFAMKNGEFSVMIGFAVGGQAVLGVVLEPVLDRVTYATAGGGCWVVSGAGEPTRCRVTERPTMDGLVVVVSHLKPGKPSRIVTGLNPARVVETFSAGIKLAMVARGDVDVYVNNYPNFHDWDVCAGHVLVEEAGGRVTETSGAPIVYGHGEKAQRLGMIATNGRVHDEVSKRMMAK
ncbi:3'(2'),5'-bisphosphate nucleotidase CysQ family protein [Fimbriiglobus ruber]|nr:inositol monophosphatase family protein [Fimbriiglobus ruber]